jgi:transposase
MTKFLTEYQVSALKAKHRTERDRRIADRIKAVILANNGWTHKRIAEALMLDEETISAHINEYRDKEKLKPENGGSESRLNKVQTQELLGHLEAKTYDKASEICVFIKEQYGVN